MRGCAVERNDTCGGRKLIKGYLAEDIKRTSALGGKERENV